MEPRGLEALLEALAVLDFPVNPQIYHDAALVTRFPDGREESEAITLVEFPAYAGRVDDVRDTLARFGFDPARIQIRGMLEEIQADWHAEAIPAGSTYVSRYKIRAMSGR